MSEKYTGTVKEIKPAEMGQNGKQKPRKVIISDSPDYAGKTFSAWEWKDWFSVFEVGKQVTVEYEKRPLPSFPDRFTNDVQVAYVAEWSGNGSGGGQPSPGAPPSSDPPPVDKYAEEAPKENPYDARSYEMEAAWAVHTVMEFWKPELKEMSETESGSITTWIHSRAITLIELKRKIAADVKQGDWSG